MSEFSPIKSRTYLFGPFGLDADGRWIMREGVALRLEPKALQVLALLVENRGRVVTKDELLQTVWPGTFVEEGILTVHISALRKALGLSANGQKYIRTIHKQGYQFAAGVREITTGNVRVLLHPRFTNLPAQTTPFVGRVKEFEKAYQLLANRETRLLTLIGPGGTGKTRLGIEVATRLADAFVDGVFWISLADLREPNQVISMIWKALGGADKGGEAEREIEELLQGANLLLLLDNFEQVIHAGVRIAGLLAACPGLSLLITSREPLRVRGEQQFSVPPLDVTSLRGASSAEAVSQNEAATLFVQHARAVNNDFVLDDMNARDIAEICVRLDGIPLAIEFAAARAKFLPTARILEQLENRFSLLRDGALDLPARQRTMRDTISWSYDLLSDEEKRGFLRFSVFMGGATPEAASAILNSGSQSAPSMLRLLSGLAEKSMLYVREQTASGPRFQMLDILREYAMERLEAGDAEDIKRLHAEHFTVLAECAHLGHHLSEQIEWLDRLEREHHNCMAALRWCKEEGHVDIGARMCLSLWKFWYTRGHLREGRMWLEWLAVETGRDGVAPAFHAAILGAAAVSIYLTAQSRKDFHRARQFLEESLAIYTVAGNNLGVLSTLNRLGGMTGQRGMHTQAQMFHKKCLRLARLLDDSRMEAISLHNLGEMMRRRGNYARAASYLTESLAISRELNEPVLSMGTLICLGDCAVARGEVRKAADLYAEVLSLAQELNHMGLIISCLRGAALAVYDLGRPAAAVRLLGAVSSFVSYTWLQLPKAEQTDFDRCMASARNTLGEDRVHKEWTSGQTMPVEGAVSSALFYLSSAGDITSCTDG